MEISKFASGVEPTDQPFAVGVIAPDETSKHHEHHHKNRVVDMIDGSNNQPEDSMSPLANIILAGGLGGAIGDTSMYPLDTIKTRQQGAPNVLKYRSMWEATKTIVKEEGIIRGVCSGYTPAMLGSLPSTMAFFATYEQTKRILILDYHVPETISYLTAGFLGDFASSFIYVPSEVIKTRLQLQGRYNNPYFNSGYNYKGMTDAAVSIVKTGGWGALFYGYKATLTRDLPFSALQFAFYEKLHQQAQDFVGENKDMGFGLELTTGAIAGGLAGTLTTPLDVVKTRVQTQNPATQINIIKESTGTTRALFDIYRSEGLSALFSGVGPRLVWTSIQSSVMLMMYQSILKLLDDRKVF